MYDFGVCSQCQQEIDASRLQDPPVVCNHCGFTPNTNQKKREKQIEKSVLKFMYLSSASMVALFMGLVVWDNHLGEVVPIKTKQLLGMASLDDLRKLESICSERGNLKCQKQTLRELGQRDIEALAKLGNLQLLSGSNEKAVKTLAAYFERGGLSLEANYDYARALEETGQVDLASDRYQAILEQKPETLQITVTKRYIKMLLDANRRERAKKVLASIRDKGSNTKAFMETVFQDL